MGGDEGSRAYLFLMFLVTLGGIFIVSALISILTDGLDTRLALLSRGRSRIIERNHTVILGWSDQVFIVLAELIKANESTRRPCVAILADLDRIEMDEMIRQRIGRTGNTRVVCRRGDPLKSARSRSGEPGDRSVDHHHPGGSGRPPGSGAAPPTENADVDVIKILLSLNARDWMGTRPTVVASISESSNLAAAQLAGGPDAHVIDADDISIRLLVQSHRQAGLCTVCTDLLDFSGNELYLRAEESLVGRTFGEALDAYAEGSAIGLRSADGHVRLNPPMDTVITAGDQVIVLAEDDVLIKLAGQPVSRDESVITALAPLSPPATNTLLLGWNHRGPKIIRLLDQYAEPGSRLVVASEHPDPTDDLLPSLLNTSIGFVTCDLNDRAQLEKLDVGAFEHVIVLADDNRDAQHADARTLVTLLHLRDMEDKLGELYSIVSEMNDDANREVAEVTKADDFVVSAKLISLYLTQLSENRELSEVFAALFSPDGSGIHLKPAPSYVQAGTSTNFATVIEAGRRRGETAIGYRVHADVRNAPHYGLRMNPDKTAALSLAADDQVIVLADT